MIKNRKTLFSSFFIISTLLMVGCGVTLKPLPDMVKKIGDVKKENPNIVFRFFDEDYAGGGYEYKYPDESKVFIAEESGKNGEVAVQMDLVANDYSGGAVVMYTVQYDLTPYYSRGALEFWIRGENGNEIGFVNLADSEDGDGIKTEIKVPISDYAEITTGWTHVSIPLADFGKRGAYWDAKKKIEVPSRFEWDRVKEFLITIEKGRNSKFTVWVDDIFVVKDVYDAAPDVDEEYWDEKEEIVSLPPVANRPEVVVQKSIFTDKLSGDAFFHGYGKRTAHRLQPTTDVATNPAVLGIYLDNADYSGITLNLGASGEMDVSKLREASGGLGFWAKFGPGVEMVFMGLLDNDLDGKACGSSISLSDFGNPDTTWQYFMIPFKEFSSNGSWWNENTQSEAPGVVDWSKIREISFTSDKYGARIEDHIPVAVYLDDISLIEKVPGYVDPDIYWNNFSSKEADLKLFSFEDESEAKWNAISGEESEAFTALIDSEDRNRNGKKVLKIEFSLYDWAEVGYNFSSNASPAELRDWTKHRAIYIDFYTDKDEEIVTLQIDDSGKEGWVTALTLKKGWNTYYIPIKDFKKYTYYQPADALVDNKLDLSAVTRFVIKPNKVGTMGTILFDNIKLTNVKE